MVNIFLVFLRLGLTSFGGPIAHLGYFRDEFVTRRRWLSDRSYADLVALCQFLPGPASSQVGMALGLARHGYAGALAAWAGFTLPSAILLILLALGLTTHGELLPTGVVHGLKIVAVAVVTQAVWSMARHLCAGLVRMMLMAFATGAALLMPSTFAQLGIITLAGVAGLLLCKPEPVHDHDVLPITISHRAGVLWLILLFSLLIGLPIVSTGMASGMASQALIQINAFFRTGALVFGGGHVVLPLLQTAVVTPGWVSNDVFLAGYGAAQAMPGPLFTFAAFLGAASPATLLSGWIGGLACLLAIFAPSFLLVAGALPFWEQLRRNPHAQAALMGINAAVVGLLLAALCHPIGTSAIHSLQDLVMAVIALIALMAWKWPPWLVVLACASAGGLIGSV